MRRSCVAWTLAAALSAACRPVAVADLPATENACAPVVDVQTTGRLSSAVLAEVSGMVASRKYPGVFWVHNDSGHPEVLFALDRTGRILGQYRIGSARFVDWEDIAIGHERDGGPSVLFIADTGTNQSHRSRTALYIVPEPMPPSDSGTKATLKDVRAVSLRYADGLVRDVEALMFDGRDSALYFVTKTTTGTSEVYKAAVPLQLDNVLEPVLRIHTPASGRRGSERVTAGDISADGSQIIVRTYTNAYLWRRSAGQTVAEAMQLPPCQPFIAPEPQGEAIAFDLAGRGFYSVSEGFGRPIYFHSLGGHPAPAP